MKPILIDALHINMGGALMILNHFINKLVDRGVNFVLLKDNRCPELQSEKKVEKMEIMSADNSSRNRYYRQHRDEFHSVLCMGNIPPCIKMPVPVYTYIHNVSILKIPTDYPLVWKLKSYLKRRYISYFSKYTQYWIVQTENTANLVNKYLPCKNKEILIYPFYAMDNVESAINESREDYVFIGEHTNAKGHEYLVDAWKELSRNGFNRTLHLTVSEPRFVGYVEAAIKSGAPIVNHGYIEHDKVMRLYQKCKSIIYPSLNESLGLGIIEAINSGCDVIGCDLPYIYSVCTPSEVFQPRNSSSIVQAVLRYEKGKSCKTRLKIEDRADELINLLLL